MKNSILLILVCILMQSCNSHKKDLAQITFTEKQDTFFGEIPNKLDKGYSIIDSQLYNSYKSESEKILYFNGIDLSGYRDKKGEFGTNYVSFEFSKKDKILNYYSVTLYYNKNISELINVLNDKIGKPIYISFFDKNDTLPYDLLWEDKISYYLLTGVTQNTPTFEVFKKQNLTIRKRMFSAGSFQYYGDYLEYLEKNNLKTHSFSYKNFVDYKTKEGNNYYIENYRKP